MSSSKKMARKPAKGRNGSADASRISDSRFAKFETDPRFRLPSRRKAKTTLDSRFAHMLDDEDFTETTQIDRYGRKLKTDKKKKALQKLYDVADEEDEDEDEDEIEADDDGDVQRELQRVEKKYDPARGGGFSASESDSDSDDSDSDSDDSTASDEEDEAGLGSSKTADTQRFREEEAQVPLGDVTNRLAVVNLDWDHIKARDLMAMFASFLPKGSNGRIERITIYPSEFGKERMQREDLEGPPREIFKSKKDDNSDSEDSESEEDSEDDEKVKKDLLREDDDEEVDGTALRSYQLDRLRYYYAVMVCSDEAAAEAIYRATDGNEYQSSSNFIDLRFIPDDVTFDEDEPHDECTEVPSNYKPVEFVTEALQHSKVKLTWDQHPEDASRKDLMKKAFSGTPAELIENDLHAYLASDSDGEDKEEEEEEEEEEDEEEEGDDGEGEGKKTGGTAKLSKKELARQKMREALGLAAEPKKGASKREEATGDMQITFMPALSENSKKKAKADEEEETTIEKYKRKEKERKEKRRQKAIAKREGRDVEEEEEEEAAEQEAEQGPGKGDGEEEDLGFDDPFFTSEDPAAAAAAAAAPGKSKTAIRKEDRLKKRAARLAEEKEKAEEREKLKALMADDDAAQVEHFDLREVMRAEKAKKKKGKKGKKGKAAEEADEAPKKEFVVNTADPRFQSMFEDPEMAIDPSNPHFKATPGMQQVLNEMRRKRRGDDSGDEGEAAPAKKAKKSKVAKASGEDRGEELASLVNAVKRKAKKH